MSIKFPEILTVLFVTVLAVMPKKFCKDSGIYYHRHERDKVYDALVEKSARYKASFMVMMRNIS